MSDATPLRPLGESEMRCPWCGVHHDDPGAPPGQMIALTAPSLDHVQWVDDSCRDLHVLPVPGQRWTG